MTRPSPPALGLLVLALALAAAPRASADEPKTKDAHAPASALTEARHDATPAPITGHEAAPTEPPMPSRPPGTAAAEGGHGQPEHPWPSRRRWRSGRSSSSAPSC